MCKGHVTCVFPRVLSPARNMVTQRVQLYLVSCLSRSNRVAFALSHAPSLVSSFQNM